MQDKLAVISPSMGLLDLTALLSTFPDECGQRDCRELHACDDEVDPLRAKRHLEEPCGGRCHHRRHAHAGGIQSYGVIELIFSDELRDQCLPGQHHGKRT